MMTAMIQGMWVPSYNCSTSYNDQGSNSDASVQFWNPPLNTLPFLSLGDVCEASPSDWIYNTAPRGQLLAVAPLAGSDNMLAHPVNFTPIWNDKGSGAYLNGTVWQMNPPQGFTAIGHVVTIGSMQPNPYAYWCVATSLVLQAQLGPQIWDDEGSGADVNVGIWRLVPSTLSDFQDAGTFFATTTYTAVPVTAFVLQPGVVQFT
jgi:hypothetical protein